MTAGRARRTARDRTRRVACGATGLAALLCGAVAPAALAQGDWVTRQQQSTWLGAFIDQPLTERTAFWFDGQWRRMDLGAEPQQLLLRPGVQVTFAPGVRAGGGYAYIATAPYGRLPIAAPTREHRLWQQLTLAHRAGPVSVSHRFRWEQRWTAALADDGAGGRERGPFTYAQRARYMVRAQGTLPGVRIAGRDVLGFVWDEGLIPVGHGDPIVRLTQNRLGAGLGLPVGARQRVEVGYMNLWNGFASRRANEVNHTLTLWWYWTGAR